MYFVYTDVESQVGERYWTGEFTRLHMPSTTTTLANALDFTNARQAYNFAGLHALSCRSLLGFKVGRRPDPVNLRSLIN